MSTKYKEYRIKSNHEIQRLIEDNYIHPGWHHDMERYTNTVQLMESDGEYFKMKDNKQWYWDRSWVEEVEEEKMWTTYEGKKIPYSKLEDTHVANIIKWMSKRRDSYAKGIIDEMKSEAKKRGLTDLFLSGAPYPFKDKNGDLRIDKDGSFIRASKSDLEKEKFYRGIDKRKEEMETEELLFKRELHYSDLYNARVRVKNGGKFTKEEVKAIKKLAEDPVLLKEYKKWKTHYEQELAWEYDDFEYDDGCLEDSMNNWDDSWHNDHTHMKRMYEYAKYDAEIVYKAMKESLIKEKEEQLKQIKPLDRPELHQAIKEGLSMCLTQKSINKLNGLKVGEEKIVELTQPVSETKSVTIDLVSILKESPVVKALKLGEEALLKNVDFSGDTLSIKVSLGTVEKEINAQVQAALAALVK